MLLHIPAWTVEINDTMFSVDESVCCFSVQGWNVVCVLCCCVVCAICACYSQLSLNYFLEKHQISFEKHHQTQCKMKLYFSVVMDMHLQCFQNLATSLFKVINWFHGVALLVIFFISNAFLIRELSHDSL